jgi:DNA-binding HxlR family transcriptional regulator
MTINNEIGEEGVCPIEALLKFLSGKWKPGIFKLAADGPLRFSSLLKQLPGINKQSLAIALRELEQAGILQKDIISEKPLHIEYCLSDKGKEMVTLFEKIEAFSKNASVKN